MSASLIQGTEGDAKRPLEGGVEAPAAKKPDIQAAQPTKAAKEAQSEDEEDSESEEESDSDDESEEDSDEVRS